MQTIVLVPQRVTSSLLDELETKEIITRICPGHDTLRTPTKESACKRIYESDATYGGHMLLAVTTDCTTFSNFGYHPDNEDILLIGEPEKPLYLLLCYLSHEEFLRKSIETSLSVSDFILLELVFNDPYLSFFTLHPNVLHGEATIEGVGNKPSFYVTEPCCMGLKRVPLENDVVIQIEC